MKDVLYSIALSIGTRLLVRWKKMLSEYERGYMKGKLDLLSGQIDKNISIIQVMLYETSKILSKWETDEK